MKKLRLKKWVKQLIAIIIAVIVICILTHLICIKFQYIRDISGKCDIEKGYICSSYEIKNYMARGK